MTDSVLPAVLQLESCRIYSFSGAQACLQLSRADRATHFSFSDEDVWKVLACDLVGVWIERSAKLADETFVALQAARDEMARVRLKIASCNPLECLCQLLVSWKRGLLGERIFHAGNTVACRERAILRKRLSELRSNNSLKQDAKHVANLLQNTFCDCCRQVVEQPVTLHQQQLLDASHDLGFPSVRRGSTYQLTTCAVEMQRKHLPVMCKNCVVNKVPMLSLSKAAQKYDLTGHEVRSLLVYRKHRQLKQRRCWQTVSMVLDADCVKIVTNRTPWLAFMGTSFAQMLPSRALNYVLAFGCSANNSTARENEGSVPAQLNFLADGQRAITIGGRATLVPASELFLALYEWEQREYEWEPTVLRERLSESITNGNPPLDMETLRSLGGCFQTPGNALVGVNSTSYCLLLTYAFSRVRRLRRGGITRYLGLLTIPAAARWRERRSKRDLQ
jgi:hypothetical protein